MKHELTGPKVAQSAVNNERDIRSQLSQANPILDLQHKIGNQAVSRLMQTKLQVNQPDDAYEREADAVARQVMEMPTSVAEPVTHIQKREDSQLAHATTSGNVAQRDPSAAGDVDVDDAIEQRISQTAGTGSPLPQDVRSFMEPRFGADMSGVRVHTDDPAVQMSAALNAQAFTVGPDIYYGAGKSPSDLELTAHELTHVVQQGAATPYSDQAHSSATHHNRQLASRSLSPQSVLGLQRAIGNRAVTALLRRGTPDAGQSHRTIETSDVVRDKFGLGDAGAQRRSDASEAEHSPIGSVEPLQSKKAAGGNLPDYVRTKMESSFGADFSDVTVHENASLAQDLNAKAFTQGNEIHFAPGEYNPQSRSGQEILSHELSHILQNREGRVIATHREQGYDISDQPELEREADRHAKTATNGTRITGLQPVSRQAPSGSVQRKSGALQLYRSLPTGGTVLGIQPDYANIYLACSNLADRVEPRVAGNVNWMQRVGGSLERALTANSMPTPLTVSFTETEGINFDWSVSINWRMGDPAEMGGATSTKVTRGGGGSVQQTSGTSSSTTDSAEVSGSVGGHEGAPGGGVKGGTATTQGTSESTQTAQQGGVSREGNETTRSYRANLIALVTVSGSANFSGSDYANPLKWGTSIGSAITTSGPQSGPYHGGTIEYQDSRPT